MARHLRPLVGLEAASSGGDGGRVEAFAAWRRFVEALAEQRPTVLVFEDIHWADDALLDFIDLIADRAGAVPLLIVCTARPELFERRRGWAGGKTNAQHDLADAALGRGHRTPGRRPARPEPAARRGAAAAARSRPEGTRCTCRSTCGCCRIASVLVRDAGGWALVGEVGDLPESLQGIIAARLDTLSPTRRR